MKAFIGKYKTGNLYLCVENSAGTAFHYITKENYPFIKREKVRQVSEDFKMKEVAK